MLIMKNIYEKVSIAAVFILMVGISCQREPAQELLNQEGTQLVEEMERLSCTLRSLEKQTTSLWDGVVETLDKNLPADMPAVERKNMLAVRNTDLIEMFMNYNDLDTSIHRLVREAGVTDATIAKQVIEVKRKMEAQEIAFLNFLEKNGQQNQPFREQWTKKYEASKHSNCK